GLDRVTSMVSGRPPATPADTGVVEVMVAAQVAEVLGVRAGGEYVAVTLGRPGHEGPIRVSGLFAAHDAAAPVGQSDPLLLETTLTAVGDTPDAPKAVRAALVTDEAGLTVLARPELIRQVQPLTGARIRLDAARLDRDWAAAAPEAVAAAELPDEAVDVAAAQPGGTAVAAASRSGELFDPATRDRFRSFEVD